jgi:uncharacterized protein YjbJ (UPF0337 family)
MSWWDRLLGRGKQAAGDVTDDASLKAEGMAQETEGRMEEKAKQAEDVAQEARDEAAEARAERDLP